MGRRSSKCILVSNVQTLISFPLRFEFNTEMQFGNKGTVSTQLYTETVITLTAPDPTLGSRARKKGNAVISGLTSDQGGQVWKIARCEIPPMREAVTW